MVTIRRRKREKMNNTANPTVVRARQNCKKVGKRPSNHDTVRLGGGRGMNNAREPKCLALEWRGEWNIPNIPQKNVMDHNERNQLRQS
jgi:hypothetical protein